MWLPQNFDATRPRVTLLMETQNRHWVPISFVADSGNDVTLINEQTAHRLGITGQCHKSIKVAGIAGPPSNYCLHTVNVRINGSNPFPLTVAVGHVRDNLLGRHGVFDRFSVTFQGSRVSFQSLSATRCCGIF